ncbi:MNNG and nitrosoguanidine resistance protein [Daldinia loculata]|nr:MNNG and nitrosoguanidine resistance protein [Daldinia loculata]
MVETSWLRYATDTDDSDGTIQAPPREYEEYAEDGRHEEPHRSAGFWDPRMDKVRREVVTNWLRTLLMLMTFILAVLSMYWGVLTHIDGNLHRLVIYVVDFDGQVAPYDDVTPLVGPTVTDVAQQVIDSPVKRKLGYTIVPPDEFGYDPIAVRQAVYDWDCWAAIIVNPNATALLQDAVATGNSSYDPTGAIQFITQSARQETTTINYIVPLMNALAAQFAARFGPTWSQTVMSNSSLDRDVIARAPAALSPGVTPLSIDLRPFGPATATPTQFLIPKGHPPLRFWQLIAWRLCAAIMTYFLVSLIYSFVSLAFQIPFSNPPASPTEPAMNPTAYGRGSFVVYWMVNFIGMCALGLACENMGIIIGQPWTAGWLIFWVITNVSTAFYAIELAPGFFRWGYAWPLHHVVQASRSILFDLHSEIGLNFGVLFAWVAVNITLFPICCYIGRWKQENGQRNGERATESYIVYDARAEGQKKVVPKEKGALPPVRKRGFMRGI